ncbi:hypothetical protein NQ318_022208 [Aromia moschata]|uniref:Ubiquinone biosynthesis protein n=1 Tax=Aromia moschata TaxID=1265417 RepID=A0AAV8XCF4_9CUCU|nr:hypothetical protein NQ318_022208 [Aromia moschata]
MKLFADTNNSSAVKNSSWDLIPIITEYLTTKNSNKNVNLFKCCEQLLNIIANNSNPEEVLLQLIEEIEETTDHTKFVVLLNPLRGVLHRIPKNRINSLAWSLNALQTFLNKWDVPEDTSLVGKEKLLLDNTENVQKITELHINILLFYDFLIEELEASGENVQEQSAVVCKFLIQLLGKPLVCLDMEVFDGIKSRARRIAENIVAKVIKIVKDPVPLLEMRFESENNDMSLTRPNALGISVLFYLVYAEEVCIEVTPKVYNPVYFFHHSLHLVTVLLEMENQMCLEKALRLASTLLLYVKFVEVPYLLLDSEDHCHFSRALSKVIVYNDAESIRKLALCVYQNYLTSFETRGFYLLVSNLISELNHTGLIGFTITKYKDRIAEEFSKNAQNVSPYLKGSRLIKVLRKFCYLHKEEESDLIELSDQIMATLNLLRYLALRDKNNVTDIWDYFKILEETYFKCLRKGIELSRAHYELKVREVEEEQSLGDNKSESEVSVTVAGRNLLEMPKNTHGVRTTTRCKASGNKFNENYEGEIKNKILEASLPFVTELGWSKEALSAGAQIMGYPGITHGMFSKGGADLVHYFQTSSNRKLVEVLKEFRIEAGDKPNSPAEFAEQAIQTRLKMIIPYISKWPQAIAIMSLPPNVPNALATLLTMVDDICYYAGDRSVDFNWYLRRIGIAAVYKATELYMIQDSSREYEETWTFLNRRLVEAVQLHDLISKSDMKSQTAKDTAQAVFVTARNILGLNWNR